MGNKLTTTEMQHLTLLRKLKAAHMRLASAESDIKIIESAIINLDIKETNND